MMFLSGFLTDLRDITERLFARPDEVMLEVGAGGERLVARLRVAVALLLLLLPLANALNGGSVEETLVGLAGAVFVNLFAQVWLALSRTPRRHRWLPFATASYDVTATTLVLLLLASHELAAGLNSLIVWCGYLIAIVVTALRNDGRVTLLAGVLAVLQYGGFVLMAFATAAPALLQSVEYGQATPSNAWQRVVLLVVFTLITAAVVYRMQRLVRMSGSDGLTGLPNRTWLSHRMPRLIEHARREHGSLSLVLIDLDRFKRINDEFGHLAGDRALKHLVRVLEDLLEDDETLVRLSGEEFVLLLRKPAGAAWERADSMRRALAESRFLPERHQEPIQITFSAGVACCPADGADLSSLLRRADQRLRAAKQGGRNCVVLRED